MLLFVVFFFFNDTATTEIYTLSLHDALPICCQLHRASDRRVSCRCGDVAHYRGSGAARRRGHFHRGLALPRSEEHTSELQSRLHLVCRLLLEKKKNAISVALFIEQCVNT